MLGGFLALGLVFLKLSYLDALFLDLKGFVSSSSMPNSDAVEVNLSALKHGKSAISPVEFLEAIKKIHQQNPRMIVVSMVPSELDGSAEAYEQLIQELIKIPQVYFYSRWGKPEGDSFATTPPFSKYPKHIINKFTQDTKLGSLDMRTRRLVLSMDGKGYDSDLQSFLELLKVQMPELKNLAGTFSLFASEQVYLKYYSLDSISTVLAPLENLSLLKGKVVFVGTSDAHSTLVAQHPFGRFSFNETQSDSFYFPDSRYLLTVYENLKNADYIKEPSVIFNWAWICVFLSLNIWLLMFFQMQPAKAVGYSFVLPLLALLFGIVIFKVFNWNLDFSRILVGNVIIQYLGVPFIFVKALRKADEQKMRETQAREKERMRSRFILKTAKADFNFKVAAKVSHDLRSPLTALQIAGSFLKGKVSEDLESLILESTSRLKHIADDTLNAYRKNDKDTRGLNPINLSALIDDLLKSYRFLYPNTNFVSTVSQEHLVFVPSYSLQRCLSNLLNNSIDALSSIAEPGSISIFVNADEEFVGIEVSDNGPGIPAEIRAKLFQEKATYGKLQGTGLGLFQVRKELEGYGGTVSLVDSSRGAKFSIKLPKLLGKVPFSVSENILILETDGEIWSALQKSNLLAAKIYRSSSVTEALAWIGAGKENSWTVLVDLTLNDDSEENGFDLLEKIKDHGSKKVVFSMLTENSDIQKIAEEYGALLLEKDRITLLEFKVSIA